VRVVIDVGFFFFFRLGFMFFQIVRPLRLFCKWILSFCLLGFSSGLDFYEPFCKFGSAVTSRGSYERNECLLCD
jgi:hypothetical protein